MIRRDTDYALRSLVHIAAGPADGTTAAELCRLAEVPVGFGQKILRRLARAGVLRARAGRGGGFSLAMPAHRLPLMQVISLIQGPLLLNQCMADDDACSRRPACPVTRHLRKAQDALDAFFATTTVADILAGDDRSRPPPRPDPGRPPGRPRKPRGKTVRSARR